MPNPQEQESQARIDKIIALIMEEAKTVKDLPAVPAIYQVLNKVRARVMEIMRTME